MSEAMGGWGWASRWNGARFEVELAAVAGWVVSLFWFRGTFSVGVFAPGDGRPTVVLGGEDQAVIENVAALVEAVADVRVGPFASGCVPWRELPGLYDALVGVSQRAESSERIAS